MGTVTVRAPRPGDGSGLAQMHLGTSAHHVEIAPDVYRLLDEEGLADFFDRGVGKGSTTQDFLLTVDPRQAWTEPLKRDRSNRPTHNGQK
jgi:hypothetical protein